MALSVKNLKLKKLVLSSLFLGLGIILPVFTGQIKEIGDTLLPMHIPVMLCGLLCGWQYGLTVGAILPFFRSVIFSMPPIYPNAVWMAFELATYGFVIGFLYSRFKRKNTVGLYISLLSAMLSGRIVWGIAKAFLLGIGGNSFTFMAFISGGFVDSILGIILQLILIPLIMNVLQITGLKNSKGEN